VTTSDGTTGAHGNGQYAEVNGINLYFEPVWLDGPRVIEGIGVTHLIYDVRPR
jgi:hypothetical protein